MLCYDQQALLWTEVDLFNDSSFELLASQDSTANQHIVSCEKTLFHARNQHKMGFIIISAAYQPCYLNRASLIFGVYSCRISMYQFCVHIDLWRTKLTHQQPNGFCAFLVEYTLELSTIDIEKRANAFSANDATIKILHVNIWKQPRVCTASYHRRRRSLDVLTNGSTAWDILLSQIDRFGSRECA